MGCDMSLFSLEYWRSKPARKRLSSDSDILKQESESHNIAHRKTDSGGAVSRLRNMFARKSRSQANQSILPTLPDFSEVTPCTLEESVERAVRNRNPDQLLKLLSQTGDGFVLLPSTKVPRKLSPVELACSLGYLDIVEVLLENGCSPNLPTTEGKLLHTVLESLKSHPESIVTGRRVVQSLISRGCDLDIKDRNGITPLLLCAQIGDGEVMKMVLSKCSSKQLYCQCSSNQYIPLHMSAMRGDLECVRLLLQQKPHKHVNVKDSAFNTALHLALKSMRHSLQYLNAARDRLDDPESTWKQHKAKEAAVCERLQMFQQNAVAIVEALVMAGADVNLACCQAGHAIASSYVDDHSPFDYALWLCNLDNTQGFEMELDPDQLSSTFNLVSRKTIQSLQDLGKRESAEASKDARACFSPYAGVVRLLVLAGAEVSARQRARLYAKYENLHQILDEVCAFWDKYQVSIPPKLVHLSKLSIRSYLASIQRLHEIGRLPLPPRMKEYVKLNYL